MKNFKVTVDGQTYNVQVEELGNSPNQAQAAPPAGSSAPEQSVNPAAPGKAAAPVAAAPAEKPKPSPGGGASVNAPMPGSVIEVKVKEGDAVKEGDVLLILEAMKMENELTAPQAGTVSGVMVKKGDTVNSGDPLITLS